MSKPAPRTSCSSARIPHPWGRRSRVLLILLSSSAVYISQTSSAAKIPMSLTQKLDRTRFERIKTEQSLIDAMKDEKNAKRRLANLRKLMTLQKAEKNLLETRHGELEKVISSLLGRKNILNEKIGKKQLLLRQHLKELSRANRESDSDAHPLHKERFESPRRRLVAQLADRSVRDIEGLKADWMDVETLDHKIQKEREELASLVQDLSERAEIMKLNQKIEGELLKKHHAESLVQLEQYQRLKEREAEVETLISQFNARQELEKMEETETLAGDFGKMKGRLGLPVMGRLVAQYGQVWDAASQLKIFKKGVELQATPSSDVSAIYHGKVAFSGTLPTLGEVVIVDHGGHYFSLCAHLGERFKKEGEMVQIGERIGRVNDAGRPIYFEIRSRNVPLNPLQWVIPSSKVGV